MATAPVPGIPPSRVATPGAHSFPSAYVLYLGELVKRWHVTLGELLDGSSLDAEACVDPKRRVSVEEYSSLLERARVLTGEPALGFLFGRQLPVSAHGGVGMLMQSASTMREAIELAVRFWPIVTTTLSMHLRVERGEASIIVEEHADFGTARDIVLLAVLLGISRVGNSMAGFDLRPYGHAEIAMPAPAYASQPPLLGSLVRFDQPVTRLVFDASRLGVPHVMGDPIALRFARDACEQTLDTIDGLHRVTARVRALLNRTRGSAPSVAEVASNLGTSSRTLKRQLANEGASFSQLVEDELRERALLLLRSNSLSTKDVAASLGYSNVSNFTRAFVRWTGRTPTEQRHASR